MPQVDASLLNLPTSLVLPGGPGPEARGRRWQASCSAMGEATVLAKRYAVRGFPGLRIGAPGPGP